MECAYQKAISRSFKKITSRAHIQSPDKRTDTNNLRFYNGKVQEAFSPSEFIDSGSKLAVVNSNHNAG